MDRLLVPAHRRARPPRDLGRQAWGLSPVQAQALRALLRALTPEARDARELALLRRLALALALDPAVSQR